MPIEHFGLGVPDVDAAKVYYDELMPMVGFQPCFGNGYCPDGFQGAQLFLYPAGDPGQHSRHGTGLHHIAFLVPTHADVHRLHDWARDRGDEIRGAPKALPQFGTNYYATYFLDPHGFMIEVVCLEQETR
jgi:catechol 2,3-dioxygenase-like lactoylglutathione lyase family enzyme